MRATPNGIEIEYETHGDPFNPTLLLIAGMGSQLVTWEQEFIDLFVDSGLHVVVFDNRDVGLSTSFDDAGKPDLIKALGGDAPYLLSDMAADTAGLIDWLGVARVHLFGVSLGAMIAQALAIEYPSKISTMTCVMTTTGASDVGQSSEAATEMLLRSSPPERDDYLDTTWQRFQVTGASPKFPVTEEHIKERASISYDRVSSSAGNARQLAAVFASGDRTESLHKVFTPTLVIHGRDDALINVDGGEALASALPNAELLIIDGMGHYLPRQVWPMVAEATLKNIARLN